MPPKSKIKALPPEIKSWLDKSLVDRGFAGYEDLVAQVNAALEAAQSPVRLSVSGVHRYGQAFEERLRVLEFATNQARAVVAASPDDEDQMTQALQRLTQERLFTLMLDLQVNPKEVDLAKITRSIADLARSSTTTKTYARKVRAELEAKTRAATQKAEEAVAKITKKAGLSDELAAEISRKILGIAPTPGAA